MPFLPWDATMSVHVDELDEQHRALIAVLNHLHDVLMAGTFPQLFAAREEALTGLERYVATHFAAEERYQERIGYPDLPAHRKLHEDFARQVGGYRAASRNDAQVLNSDLVKTMIRWVHDHLVDEDSKYARFAAGRLGQPAAAGPHPAP
jgi:hemerythrin